MKVKLKTDFWELQSFALTLQTDALTFSGPTTFSIPLSQLIQISLAGKHMDRFILETTHELYEGYFFQQEDAKQLIDYLSAHQSVHLELRLCPD